MRKYLIYPTEFPLPWASAWGQDEYGLWLAFSYKGVQQRFRWMEPDSFLMGSPENEPGRWQHEVTLSQGYWLADTTVTQALWQAVMDENPSRFIHENRPVDQISWLIVQEFLQKLNKLQPELFIRLPSEAEWEYACRAGSKTAYAFGDDISKAQVNFEAEETVEVKSLPGNDWGLYEMHGNVWEWCQDWYGDYPTESVTDPMGAENGTHRVLRGGSWDSGGGHCRSAFRGNYSPVYAYSDFGFRLARGQ